MIELKNLELGYYGNVVVSAISGHFQRGSMTAVIGANGCGKSTLLKTLAGLLPPISGSVNFQDNMRPRIAWLPQLGEMDRQFPATVYDVVCMGSWPGRGLFSGLGRKHRERVMEAIERVGLSEHYLRPIDVLSGGQFQRMLFARLLVQDAPLVLLDEPFTGVDAQTSEFLMELMCQMHRDGKTLISVLHNNELVRRHFPEVLLLTSEGYQWGNADEALAQYASFRPRLVQTA
ncbi:Iron(3+)-hydroxamate import ATP-binding protein FhuC [Cedecea lapagei]|uniref:Iron(3+)-hydroxamate import ATP-binding protein FhuC n=1 Tax=Cedecea lapagei TaxID=158823 RepID=A0A3S4IKW0_9ENTR|nr:ABC transporter ATP-binding protein [Cedecea lapagei]VEB95672.1 Iron(3+)-hydroxamate import ATP-binding protein FhuC [Cedecea lapagei]